jgi:DNA-binding SARP family transcriptional activator
MSQGVSLELRVLGPVEVVIKGTPVRLAKRQHRLILGILGIEANRSVSSGRLVDLLWWDRPPARPRAVLHSRMSELRAVLRAAGGTPVIVTGEDGYALRIPAGMVDAHRFSELVTDSRRVGSDLRLRDVLRQALDLWRGPVLGGWSPVGPTGALLGSIESARLTAAEDLYDAELRLGNHVVIADELLALSAAHPTRDRLTAAAMLALHRAGRSAEAVSVHHQRRIWLSAELGVDLAPALRQLHVAILRHDPILDLIDPVHLDHLP